MYSLAVLISSNFTLCLYKCLLISLKSKINCFLPLDCTDTVKGFTTKGASGVSSIKPLANKSKIAVSTNSAWFNADLLFGKHTDVGFDWLNGA